MGILEGGINMNIKMIGKNIEVTDAMKEYVENKADRLEKFENDNTELTVVCSIEREEQIVELQLSHNGDFIKIEERNNDLYASIDLALDRLERQMRKDKEKRADKNKDASLKDKISNMVSNISHSEEGAVTKTKCYEIKPLSLEDAKLKLSSSDDMFLTYIDATSKAVHVLYKRGDSTFGLVIPE